MPLSLQPNFVTKVNSVLPLAQATGVNGLAVRVASLVNDVLGTVTAVTPQGTVAFSLSPETPSWVTGQVDSTGLIYTVSFSNAVPNGGIPYEFYVVVSDGTSTLYFPILLDVKPPLSLAITAGAFTGLTTVSIPSYDSTQADIQIQGIGLNAQPQSGISFIPPASMPTGLEFLTSDGTKLLLHVADPTPGNVAGGLQTYVDNPISTQITILAYAPGYFYDEPDRAFAQTFTIDSLTAKQGTLDFMVGVYYDNNNTRFSLEVSKDFIQGMSPSEAININWTASGTATGNFSSTTSASTTWTPTAQGNIQFTVSLQGAISLKIYGSKTTPTIAVGPSGPWTTSSACKIGLDAQLYQGYAGDTLTVTVSTPNEFQGGETITVSFTVEEGSAIESTIPAPPNIVLQSGTLTGTASVTLPASTIHQKWGLRASALSSAARAGFAEAILLSLGSKTLNINNGALVGNTGSTITPYQLTAEDVESLNPVSATFYLVGAPDGLTINGSNQIVGNALVAGVYTFQVLATAAGYENTLSSNFTLTVTQVATPLTITNPTVVGATTTPPIETNNTPFTVAWSITGTPKPTQGVLFLQSGSVSGPRDVTGATQASTSQPTTSVVGLYGSSFYGNAYTIPVIVLSSSIQASEQLIPSPTIGTIDENNDLVLNWQPLIVAGGYTVYRAWDIYLNQPPLLPPNGLQTISGNLPTGLEFPGSTPSNRIFEATLASGDWNINMTALTATPGIATNSNPWDATHVFPTALTATAVTLSAKTLQLGQSLTISLNPTYTGAQFWSVTYPDGTTTGFIPIGTNTRSVAKAFNTPGPQNIVIQTENDFSAGDPPVKLRRQITLQVYVTNQQFTTSSGAQADLTGTLGIGGAQGFEIVDATNAAITPQPWEVISRSLVRDTVTNELKLMVATSRYASASSLLDTMALDVYPIQGRPLSPELIDIPSLFAPTATTSAIPVKITTATLPTVIVGKPMTAFSMGASGGTPNYNWYTDSSLPFGLQLTQDGTLFGTPLELGTFDVNFAVQDSSDPVSIASVTLPLQINTDLVITTASLPDATVNTPYGGGTPFYMANTGGLPPFTWSLVAGAFPTGLSINAVTGQIQGVPVTYNSTTDFKTTYTVTIQVKDTIGAAVQAVYTMRLLPAALGFGNVDQNAVYATESFKLVVPVYGGQSPYTLTAFTDDGVIGSGLQVVSPPPDTVSVIAGHTPPVLTLTTSPGPTPFYPAALPQNISFDLSNFTSGGTPPYNWSITASPANTLPQAQVYGSILTGYPSINGTYQIGVTVVDSIGHVAQATFSLVVQQQNAPTGSPEYQVFPVAVSFNGNQSNPFSWSVLPITDPPVTSPGQPNIPVGGVAASFPDAQVTPTTPWTPVNVDSAIFAATGSHTIYQSYDYFGVAVYQNGVLHMTQNGAASKVWAASTIFNVGDTVIDTNGKLEIVTAAGTTTTVEPGTVSNLTSAGNASAGNTTYNGTFSTALPAGYPVVIAGFLTAANNGTFSIVACTGTQLTVNNPNGTSESHAATATFNPWSTVGAKITDGTVTWTNITTPISGPMDYFTTAQDEEPGGPTDPGGFPSWLNPQNGTTVAGGAFRDFSGIVLFNVSGGSNPITVDTYSWLSLFTGVVSTDGSLQAGAVRTSVVATSSGQQSAPSSTVPGGTPNIVITDTDIWSMWAPSSGYVSGNEILDLNSNIQKVTSVTGSGLSGAAVPNWNKNNGGTTTDNQVTWTNQGAATPITVNLTTLMAGSLTYPWYVPLIAEGGSGGPYTFQIISAITGGLRPNPSTLPGVTLSTLNKLPAFASPSTTPGDYQVSLIATDSVYTTATWQASTAYSLGQTIVDTNGNIEEVTHAGTSGASQPTWPTLVGGTKVDGGVTWTNIGKHVSEPYAIAVSLIETATQQVHILNTNLPTTLYGPANFPGELGRQIPANTYFVQADLVSNWNISGQPAGVSITTTPSNRGYLTGTPTANGVFNCTVTATSASFGTVATYQFTVTVVARQASIATPLPTSAIVGINYRAVNNNALFSVNYVGYQPTDPDLPLLASATGTVGAPGVLNGGLPTTQVVNLTPNGFTMLFDYQNNTVGSDTVTLKHNLNVFGTAPLVVVYSTLIATGTQPAAQLVSEYSVSAILQPPLSIVGGNPPYTIDITGESDARFVPVNNPGQGAALQITVAQFTPGNTYACQVSMVASDTETSPQTSQATGTVSVTIKLETYITVNYNTQTWNVPASSSGNIYYLVLPNGTGSPASSNAGVQVLLGHSPYALNVTSVTIPGGLTGFVTVSPSKRVIAINTSGANTNVNDVDNHLTPQGVFSVPTTASPSIGQYVIGIGYQVVDAHGITSTGNANVNVNIS